MKNKLLLGLFVGTILFSLAFNIFYSEKVFAHATPAYSYDTSVVFNNQDWMSSIAGESKLSTLSLPGTHDTMANIPLAGNIQTQSMTLNTQLESGIRVLDIRCKHINNRFLMYHDAIYLGTDFDNVLQTVTGFLQRHPKETVLMMVGNEGEEKATNTRTFIETYEAYRNKPEYNSYFWPKNSSNPTLEAVRGKIVEFDSKVGIDFSETEQSELKKSQQQDQGEDWHLISSWYLYRKWVGIKNHINAASAGNPKDFYINYLNGNWGLTPYTVASGHAFAGTGDDNLSSGLLTSYCPSAPDSIPLLRETCWADFPRKDCVGTNCFIYYEGTNVLTYQRLANKHLRVGIIMADFPGPGLVERIIKQNNCSS